MSGYEKYVEQVADEIQRVVYGTVLPEMSGERENCTEAARAALAVVGPLIEEDTRDRMVTAAGRALEMDPDVHVYLSTACLHGTHQHCQGTVNLQGEPKQPQECKWCSSPCICCCHQGATP